MTAYKSDFLNVMKERGYIHQMSDETALDELLSKEMVTCYVGYDATASSLHVGNLVSIMMLYWFQQTGHRPIALMGGGTSMVGDPSGKDESRQLMTVEKIAENKEGIKQVFSKFLDFGDTGNQAIMIDNADWLLSLNYVEFLRTVGRHLSINQMLARDSIKLRLEREQHLSFLEFNYMCLQAYDYTELARRHNCRLQMGGSDQWGNIVSGVDLGRRMGAPELYALTTPLLTTASGAKMGKSAAGAVWLSETHLPVYDYWQYWRNTEDADIGRFMKLYTTLPLDEIAKYEALNGSELNEAKKVLATEATAMVHGRDAAETAAETARKTFEEGQAAENLPSISVASSALSEGIGLLSLIVEAGLANSNGEARRHVKGGAIKLNDAQVSDERLSVGTDHLDGDGVIKLSMGKKKHVLVKPQ